jgi:hypothetical protein
MPPAHDHTAAATADYIVVEPARGRDLIRKTARAATTACVLILFGYCLRTAWDVLQGLGRVSVADVAQALRVVSVRDAILCVVGYRIGRELLTALLHTRRAR